MEVFKKFRFLSLLVIAVLVVIMAVTGMSIAQPQSVDLGTARSFAVLAGSAITNTGPTTISGTAGGDVGLSPASGTAITGLTTDHVEGTIYTVDAFGPDGSVENADLLTTAKNDLTTAYNDAANRTVTETIDVQLGGQTLTPGVYDELGAGTFNITGTLTLDAEGDPNAVFIFQASSTLVTASDSKIVLINGAQPCRVFWQVGSSATLGTDSIFVGHILALTSITANNGAEVEGQLLAQEGAVTLDDNTIINDVCVEDAPSINVEKQVSVDGGDTWLDADSAPGPSIEEGSEVLFRFVVTNTGNVDLTDITLNDDVYDLSGADLTDPLLVGGSFEYILAETAEEGQHQNTATVTGEHGGVTYSNSDVVYYSGLESDIPATGSLTVDKVVSGDTEGITLPSFEITVAGPEGFTATRTLVDGESFTWSNLVPGTYTVTEDKTGLSEEWTVSGEGDVTVVADQTARTTITNTFLADDVPIVNGVPATGSLTVDKVVSGDTGDMTLPLFEITVAGPEGFTATRTLVDGESFTWSNLVPGAYIITENKDKLSNKWAVSGEGTVSVVADQTALSTITNEYKKVTPRTGSMVPMMACSGLILIGIGLLMQRKR